MLLKLFWNRTTLAVGSILTALMLSAFALLQQVSERTEELIGLIAVLILGALGARPMNWLKDKFGLPVILYVFNGAESTSANRIMNANYRQMTAAATEFDEWSRQIFRQQQAAMQDKAPKLVRTGIVLPKGLK